MIASLPLGVMNSEKQGGCDLHSCLGLWDGGPKSSRELGREETGPERVRKWEGVPSTLGRWRDGEGGTGMGSLGVGRGAPTSLWSTRCGWPA